MYGPHFSSEGVLAFRLEVPRAVGGILRLGPTAEWDGEAKEFIDRINERPLLDSSCLTSIDSLPFPQSFDARKLLALAEKSKLGVRFTPGEACGGDPGCMRLCFAFYSPGELKEGAKRLAMAIDKFNS